MTAIDLLSGLFNDVLQGRHRRSSFAGFRLRTLAENPAKLIAGVAYQAKRIKINSAFAHKGQQERCVQLYSEEQQLHAFFVQNL